MKITLIQLEPNVKGFKRGNFTCLNGLKSPGMSSIGAALRRGGHRVKIIQQGALSDEEVLQQILNDLPDWAGFSSMSYDFPSVCSMIDRLPPALPVVIGGSHITIAPGQLPKRKNTFGVLGEGEVTVLELWQKDVSEISGICYWEGEKLVVTQPRPRIRDLDSLPFGVPSIEIIGNPFIGKLMFPTVANQQGTELAVAQRGCPFDCEFCASQYVWKREVVRRSIDNVVAEIISWQKRGVNCAFLSDLMVNIKAGYAKALFRGLIDADNQIKLYTMMRLADMRARPLFDEEMIELASLAGVTKLGAGLESFSPQTQRRYHKVFTLDTARDFFRFCDKYGILSKAFLIIGPEYDEDSARCALEVLNDLLPDEIRISFEVDFSRKALNAAHRNGTLSDFHTDAPVLPGRLTAEMQITARNWLREAYYRGCKSQNHEHKKCQRFPHLWPAFQEYRQHLTGLGV